MDCHIGNPGHRCSSDRPVSTTALDLQGRISAEVVSRLSHCSKRQVGAVVLSREGVIVSEGFNHGPETQDRCVDGGCPRASSGVEGLVTSYLEGDGKCHALHAEEMAWIRAGWANLVGATTYVSCDLCLNCKRLGANLPLARIVTPNRIYLPKDL